LRRLAVPAAEAAARSPMTDLRRHLPLVGLLLVSLALCLPLTLLPGETPYTFDETNFYLPAILDIQASWPQFDVTRNSLSATAPGYQYVLATLGLATDSSLLAFRLINLAVSLLLPVVLWYAWSPAMPAAVRFWSILPLAGGCFFVRSACNVMTDNAALLAATVSLVLVLVPRFEPLLGASGIAAAASVAIRQISIWVEAPLLVRLWFIGRRAPWWTAVPAPAVVLALIAAWGGLVPPAWKKETGGLGLSAAPYQFAVLAVLGGFFLHAAGTDWRAALRDRLVRLGAAVGLFSSLYCATSTVYEEGRWGGYFWNAAERLPVIAERSVVFIALAPIGGAMLAMLGRRVWTAAGSALALTWLATFAAFFASSLLNRQVHQRYYEPVMLVLLMFWLALVCDRADGGRVKLWPLVILTVGQVGITLLTAYGRTFGYF